MTRLAYNPPPNNPKLPSWEPAANPVDDNWDTDRLPVPGGWLYRTQRARGVAMCFVPDTRVILGAAGL